MAGCLFSCASNKLKKPTFKKAFKGFCFTGSGKGRLVHAKGRHFFTYESLWAKEKDTWSLALNLPIVGQEVIHFSYKNVLEGRVETSGTFANRISNEAKNPAQSGLNELFAKSIGELLFMLEREDSLAFGKKWTFSLNPESLIMESDMSRQYLFRVKSFEWDDFYQRVTFSLRKRLADKKFGDVFRLELFVSECTL